MCTHIIQLNHMSLDLKLISALLEGLGFKWLVKKRHTRRAHKAANKGESEIDERHTDRMQQQQTEF